MKDAWSASSLNIAPFSVACVREISDFFNLGTYSTSVSNKSLISLTKATENGAIFKLLADHASFKLKDQEIPLQQGDDNMLYLPLSKDEEPPPTSMIYHERFGHPGREIAQLLTQKYSDLNGKLEHRSCQTTTSFSPACLPFLMSIHFSPFSSLSTTTTTLTPIFQNCAAATTSKFCCLVIMLPKLL